MAVLPPKGRTVDRRPSLRGTVMQDVSHGVERNRAWPQKRKKNLPEVTKDQNDLFRQYQWATKYWDPKLYKVAMEAVRGTPLLPRDIMTMIMANRLACITKTDGTRIYPMTAVRDVSESLDVITQTPGQSIRRGQEVWEPYTPSPGGGGGSFSLIQAINITTPVPNLVFTALDPYSELLLLMAGVTASGSTQRRVVLSSNGGFTYYQSSGDYREVSVDGVRFNTAAIFLHGTASALERHGALRITGNVAGAFKTLERLNVLQSRGFEYFAGTTDVINALRLEPSTSVNFTGGSVYLFGRE